jgi:hypothetical protein
MSDDRDPTDLTTHRVVLDVPGTEAVRIRRDVPYRSNAAPGLDIYSPPDSGGTALPAVVFITGYPDPGFEQFAGCKLKEMGQYVSWARLLAASGVVAITYENTDPVADACRVIEFIRESAADLGIDAGRVGIWSCSGNVPNALSLLSDANPTCAVLYYGYMLDLYGTNDVADAATNFGFSNPCAGRSPTDLPKDVPLFIVRAGRDETPGLNRTIDHFVTGALACNLPVTLINHAEAPHAFDVADDSNDTCNVIEATLAFLLTYLSV